MCVKGRKSTVASAITQNYNGVTRRATRWNDTETTTGEKTKGSQNLEVPKTTKNYNHVVSARKTQEDHELSQRYSCPQQTYGYICKQCEQTYSLVFQLAHPDHSKSIDWHNMRQEMDKLFRTGLHKIASTETSRMTTPSSRMTTKSPIKMKTTYTTTMETVTETPSASTVRKREKCRQQRLHLR